MGTSLLWRTQFKASMLSSSHRVSDIEKSLSFRRDHCTVYKIFLQAIRV